MGEEEGILSTVNARNQEPVFQRKTPIAVNGFDPEDQLIQSLLLSSAVEPALSDDVHCLPVVDKVDLGGFSRYHEYSCLWCLGLREGDGCRWDCPVSEFCGGRAWVRALAAARVQGLYLYQLDHGRAQAGVWGRDDPRKHAVEFRRLADALVRFCAGDERAPEKVSGDGLRKALHGATNDDPAVIAGFLESLASLFLVFEVTRTAADPRSAARRTALRTLIDMEEKFGLETNPSALPAERAERILNAVIALGQAGQRDVEKDTAIVADALQRMRRCSFGRRVLGALGRERRASYRQRKPVLDRDLDRLLPIESA